MAKEIITMETQKFDQWAIIEIFGHQRISGRVTQQTMRAACRPMLAGDLNEMELPWV